MVVREKAQVAAGSRRLCQEQLIFIRISNLSILHGVGSQKLRFSARLNTLPRHFECLPFHGRWSYPRVFESRDSIISNIEKYSYLQSRLAHIRCTLQRPEYTARWPMFTKSTSSLPHRCAMLWKVFGSACLMHNSYYAYLTFPPYVGTMNVPRVERWKIGEFVIATLAERSAHMCPSM